MMTKKTLKKNPSEKEEGRGAKVLQTYIQTYRPSDKAIPRGAFAPKKNWRVDKKQSKLQKRFQCIVLRVEPGSRSLHNIPTSSFRLQRYGVGHNIVTCFGSILSEEPY